MSSADADLIRHFINSGTITAADCACGRLNFYTGSGSQLDDIDSLRERAARDPDRYVEHAREIQIAGFLGIGNVVVGCPCRQCERAIEFLLRNAEPSARLLLEYFERRSGRLRRELESSERTEEKLRGQLDLFK